MTKSNSSRNLKGLLIMFAVTAFTIAFWMISGQEKSIVVEHDAGLMVKHSVDAGVDSAIYPVPVPPATGTAWLDAR